MSKKSKTQKEIVTALKGIIEAVKRDTPINCDIDVKSELKTICGDYVADIVETGRYTITVNLTLQKEMPHD